MNRLIIIGNGFDLAHGLKTSYKDFLKWYYVRAYTTAEAGSYKDDFITVHRNYPHKFQSPAFTDITEWVDFVFEKKNYTNFNRTNYENKRYVMANFFSTTYRSTFFKRLTNQCFEANWVDIENEFYKQLVSLLQVKPEKKKQQIHELNAALTYIINLLEEYLSSLSKPKDINRLSSILMSRIQQSDFIDTMPDLGKLSERKLILNFNYTDTIESYLSTDEESPFNYEVNYIHGKINDPENQLIFGFGDELDDNYKQLEHSNINAFLSI